MLNAGSFIERQIRFCLLTFASVNLPAMRLPGTPPLHFISERVFEIGHEDSWAAAKPFTGRPAALPLLQER